MAQLNLPLQLSVEEQSVTVSVLQIILYLEQNYSQVHPSEVKLQRLKSIQLNPS